MLKVTKEYLSGLLLHRQNESHKGDYGHLLLVCGSASMPGAAVLATGASLSSGCGLVTLHAPEKAGLVALASFPSAMLSIERGDCFSCVPANLKKYSAIGIGPGMGRSEASVAALYGLMENAKTLQIPMLLDADALNIISAHPDMLGLIPKSSLMTPHAGEFARLAGSLSPQAFASRAACVLVMKGFHTRIYTPDGEVFENSTGNPGMAKGGSGDVLTGLTAGLMARGYDTITAALLGVWLHGFAGDCLSEKRSCEAYSSRDLIDSLYLGFKTLYGQASNQNSNGL